MAAKTKGCTYTGDLAETDLQIKTLSELLLESGTGRLRSVPTLLFEKGSHSSAKFVSVTVPFVFQSRFPTRPKSSPQSVGVRLAD